MADTPTTDLILSAEFTDTLSDQLLVVPDPQFVFARWAYAALAKQQQSQLEAYNVAMLQLQEGRIADTGALANTNQAMSMGMGGPLQLAGMNLTYADMFMMVREAAQPGTTIKIDRPVFIDGATTIANRKLNPGDKLFANSQPITRDQVAVTIYEYMGPGNAAGNPTPISLSLFAQHRAKHDLLADVSNQLRRDRYKFIDDVIINSMLAATAATSGGVTRGGDVASNSAFVGSGNEPMSLDLVLKAVEALKTRNVPGISFNGQYVMVLHPHQIQQLKNDPAYQRLSVFQPAYNTLFPGYASTVENVIMCESQRLPTLTNLGAGSNQTGWQGLVIAPSCLGWACAMDAKVVRDKNDDGGRFAKFAWIAFEGWQMLDASFVQAILTT